MPKDVATLHAEIDALIAEVAREGASQAAAWTGEDDRAGLAESADPRDQAAAAAMQRAATGE